MNDDDCGGASQGSCIDIHVTSRPMKQCFCNQGWFGVGCANRKLKLKYSTMIFEYILQVLLSLILPLMLAAIHCTVVLVTTSKCGQRSSMM